MLPLSAHKLYQLQQECSKQWLSGILRQRTGKALGGNGNRHAGLVLVQESCHMQVTNPFCFFCLTSCRLVTCHPAMRGGNLVIQILA